MASQWFRDNVLVQSNFMTAQDFQADIRRFLLSLNETREEDQLVFSLELLSCQVPPSPRPPSPDQVAGRALLPPAHRGPGQLQADLSLGSSVLSIQCTSLPEAEVETVVILASEVERASPQAGRAPSPCSSP
jgi:hypothetical protein